MTLETLSTFWLVVGLLFAGVGIVPLALIGSAWHGAWPLFWDVLISLVITYAARVFGARAMESAERSGLERSEQAETLGVLDVAQKPPDFDRKEVSKIFESFGYTVRSAQSLESQIVYMLLMKHSPAGGYSSDEELETAREELYKRSSTELVEQLYESYDLAPALARELLVAFRTRDVAVRRYLVEQPESLWLPEDRASMLKKLDELKTNFSELTEGLRQIGIAQSEEIRNAETELNRLLRRNEGKK